MAQPEIEVIANLTDQAGSFLVPLGLSRARWLAGNVILREKSRENPNFFFSASIQTLSA
jgi:hypothetical protein